MNTILYSQQSSSNKKTIYDLLLRLVGSAQIHICADHAQLAEGLLSRDLSIDTAVLLSRDDVDLEGFIQMKALLEWVDVFLFLHSSDNSVIAQGHSLKPRFVGCEKEGLDEFVGVIEHYFQHPKAGETKV